VRWAVHSFALGRNIAIAVVDAAVEPGETVTITYQAGTSKAKVTALPFV
jgi:glycine cleavage system aminomethyltransferase T